MARGGGAPHDDTLPLSRTSAELIRGGGSEAALSLIVFYRAGAVVAPLREGASITIGRGAPSDVVIDDRSLSRCHARFRLREGLLEVEDLGSTNGTEVRGEIVRRAQLRPGERVQLGAVVVSPHMRSALEPEIEGLRGHDEFCERVDDELARARFFGDGFAVLHVEPAGPSKDRPHVSRWWSKLSASLRPVDRAALYGPSSVEILLVRMEGEAALEIAEALTRAAPRNDPLLCGVAAFPGTAATRDRLLESARAAARAATPDARAVLSQPVRSAPLRPEDLSSGLVVAGAGIRGVVETIERLSRTKLPVLIVGETGTGKELVARAIHAGSAVSKGPMLSVNCGAIPGALVESTLFGHEKGAFTGAVQASPGVFRAAHQGTLLLDEVGELPAPVQVALLRALESGRIVPVGSTQEVPVDVRVIAATHRDLEAMSSRGEFRSDLYYRLAAFTLQVPPLRERRDEIPALAERFLEQTAASGARRLEGFEPDALEALRRYGWPGNVRELRNAVDHAAVIAQGDRVALDDLPQRVRGEGPAQGSRRQEPAQADDADVLAGGTDLRERVRAFETKLIAAALKRTGGNQTEAAALLGVPVRTLSDKIQRLGLVKT